MLCRPYLAWRREPLLGEASRNDGCEKARSDERAFQIWLLLLDLNQ
jgi:hypothetical protein